MKKLFIILISLAIVGGGSFFFSQKAEAADLSQFRAGRIIDDIVFTNNATMSAQDIQNFLNQKNSVCLKDFRSLSLVDKNGDGIIQDSTTEQYGPGTMSAAELIKAASDTYRINPRVILVTLQKEQGLITRTDCPDWRYNTALGYGCPDTAPCDQSAYGFTRQIDYGTYHFRGFFDDSLPSVPYGTGNTKVYYNPGPYNNAEERYYGRFGTSPDIEYCGSSIVNIQNRATASLYNYTPYQPNAASLSAGYGTAEPCGAYGNRNFYNYFTDWFGTTLGTVHNGVDYNTVFDATYYLDRYPDLRAALSTADSFNHFIRYGINEGRQASENFNVISYRNRYPDLRMTFRGNLHSYFLHYINYGKNEGRIGTGVVPLTPVTSFRGVNYTAVYDFDYYINSSPDLKKLFTGDDFGAIEHFVLHGLKEGRQASTQFNVKSYSNNNPDLRSAFGTDLIAYYLHYIKYGQSEGRVAIGDTYVGVTRKGSVDYGVVYNFNEYFKKNPDLIQAFGSRNDLAALDHFINYGMREGRNASETFNVTVYKNNYADLRAAFGNDLRLYYLHYINHGKDEGRTAI